MACLALTRIAGYERTGESDLLTFRGERVAIHQLQAEGTKCHVHRVRLARIVL
jgi:hypothetical protein